MGCSRARRRCTRGVQAPSALRGVHEHQRGEYRAPSASAGCSRPSAGCTSPKRRRGVRKPQAPARGAQAPSASAGCTSPKRQRGVHKPQAPARGAQAPSAARGASPKALRQAPGAAGCTSPKRQRGVPKPQAPARGAQAPATPRWRLGLVRLPPRNHSPIQKSSGRSLRPPQTNPGWPS